MARMHRRSRPDVSESYVMPTEHDPDPDRTSQLIDESHEVADKLERDGATRGDLKIIARALKELRYSFKVFKQYRRQRKVTVFGSARTAPGEPAYEAAAEFSRRLAEEGWYVVTGAGGGIMEAGHVGAGAEKSIGLNIMLPFEQSANSVMTGNEKLINLKYFFTRKLLFVKEVHAITLFAGGFGTQDEGFETLTLVQTGKRDMMPIVCVDAPGASYWSDWLEFVKKQLLGNGLISPSDLSLLKVTDDVDEAVDEILRFYSVYNSMRYVRGQLYLRLHVEPPAELIERLNDEFSDIVAKGAIERVETHPYEADDEHLADLPRIAFNFNRRDFGRLRQLIDLINDELDEDSE